MAVIAQIPFINLPNDPSNAKLNTLIGEINSAITGLNGLANGNVTALTASATLTAAAAGTNIILNAAAGLTVTLPAAQGTGNTYTFLVGTTVTSNNDVIVTHAGDYINGTILQNGATNATDAWPTTAATNTTVTLNGSTKGGFIGDKLVYTDIAANQWVVSGVVGGSGTRATPIT